MQCPHAQELLHARLDGAALPPADADALEGHVRECPGCARLRAGLDVLARGLARLMPPPAPPGLDTVTVARVYAQQRGDARRRRAGRVTAGVAVAAGVLVALGLGARLLPRTAPVPPDGNAVAVVPETPPEPANLRETVQEAGSAVAALTTRTADSTVESSRLLFPAVLQPMVPPVADLDPPAEPPGRHLADAGEGVREGFQPVADSARRAFHLFVRELPAVDAPGRPGS